jgi:hypothetical protein
MSKICDDCGEYEHDCQCGDLRAQLAKEREARERAEAVVSKQIKDVGGDLDCLLLIRQSEDREFKLRVQLSAEREALEKAEAELERQSQIIANYCEGTTQTNLAKQMEAAVSLHMAAEQRAEKAEAELEYTTKCMNGFKDDSIRRLKLYGDAKAELAEARAEIARLRRLYVDHETN